MRISILYRCRRKHSKNIKKDVEVAEVFINAFFAPVFNGKTRDVPQCSVRGPVLINNFINDVDEGIKHILCQLEGDAAQPGMVHPALQIYGKTCGTEEMFRYHGQGRGHSLTEFKRRLENSPGHMV